jgi:hypothetical protein
MNIDNANQPSPFSSPIERPWYLTMLAVLLLLWGAGNSLQFMSFTVGALSSGRGPAYLLFFFIYMHVLWWALVVAGIGIFRGADWARWVMSGALIGLLIGTALQLFTPQSGIFIKVIAYPLIIWLTFTKRASKYFAGNVLASRVEGLHEANA